MVLIYLLIPWLFVWTFWLRVAGNSRAMSRTAALLGLLLRVGRKRPTDKHGEQADLNVVEEVFGTQVAKDMLTDPVIAELKDLADHVLFNKRAEPRWTEDAFIESFVAQVQRCHDLGRRHSVGECFTEWAKYFFSTELEEWQKNEPKYQLAVDRRGWVSLTSQQNSFVQAMLRKRLGSKHLATFLFANGLPSVLQRDHGSATREMVQPVLEWLVRFARISVTHRNSREVQDQQESDFLTRDSPSCVISFMLNLTNPLTHPRIFT